MNVTPHVRRPRRLSLLLATIVLLAAAGAAEAQPFGAWLSLVGNTLPGTAGHGFAEIPHHAELNPTGQITIEAWINFQTPFTGQTCRSIVGKNFTQTYWLGVCNSTLRSYLKGGGSVRDGGTIPANIWTHVAVTYDGANRRHFINGVQVAIFPEVGALPTNTADVRIGSDVAWEFSPAGQIDEVRIWNVARTAAEIQSTLTTRLYHPTPGLVAVWGLDVNANDGLDRHDGTLEQLVGFLTVIPAGPFLFDNEFADFRYKVRIGTGATQVAGTLVNDCISETVCISGQIPGRSEVFLRVVGPRANGFLWPTLVKFTTSQVEIWMEQISSGDLQYYLLEGAAPNVDELPGLFDRQGFLP